jgi:hypothetical protein
MIACVPAKTRIGHSRIQLWNIITPGRSVCIFKINFVYSLIASERIRVSLWDANDRSASQVILHLLWTPTFHYRICQGPPLVLAPLPNSINLNIIHHSCAPNFVRYSVNFDVIAPYERCHNSSVLLTAVMTNDPWFMPSSHKYQHFSERMDILSTLDVPRLRLRDEARGAHGGFWRHSLANLTCRVLSELFCSFSLVTAWHWPNALLQHEAWSLQVS